MREDSKITNRRLNDVAYPVVPLPPDRVYFPHHSSILVTDKKQIINAVKYAQQRDSYVLLLNTKAPNVESPKQAEDFHQVGVLARVKGQTETGNELRLAIDGVDRVVVLECFESRIDDFLHAKVRILPESTPRTSITDSLLRTLYDNLNKYAKNYKRKRPMNPISIPELKANPPGVAADIIAGILWEHTEFQRERYRPLLDLLDAQERIEKLIEILNQELELLNIDNKIESDVREQYQKQHQEFYLNEKMKAIHKQLGKGGRNVVEECEELRKKIKEKGMSEEAQEKVLNEVDRLEQVPPMSAEAGVIRTYVDWFLALPWNDRTDCKIDINEAEKILDEDHYGLAKPKDRILEYLAVLKLVDKLKGPILCFVGPPGVGKTSLGKSIARATNRQFVRMALGGVRDEADIRGHRRTYIGAIPGRILQGIRDAKAKNPLFLLDEVDKVGRDWRGDPASALLEVLDPEQNSTFRDHYLDVEFDLSEVMFIATANVLHTIHPTLKDRMEVIELPGYTEYEKQKIAELFLIPKELEAHGLKEDSVTFPEEAIQEIIRAYTQEAGVRNLEREIASISRKIAKKIVKEGELEENIIVEKSHLREYLGVPKHNYGKIEEEDGIGVAIGLSVTELGTSDIISIEATTMTGDGTLTLTGRLGEVMQESAQAALGYIRSQAPELNVPDDFDFEKRNIHIHVPAGAQPKEGPSAGITIATAMVSALTERPVSRDVAMTGEISLRGKVLPIGGLKEKALAAHRAGIKNIIIPKENEKDMPDIPQEIKDSLHFHTVDNMDKVLEIALRDEPDVSQ